MRLNLRTSRGYGLNVTTKPMTFATRTRPEMTFTAPVRTDRSVDEPRDDRGDDRTDRS